MEALVGEDDVVAVAVDEQHVAVLDLGMASRYAGRLQVLLLAPVRLLDLDDPRPLLHPLAGDQFEHFFVVLLLLGVMQGLLLHEGGSFAVQQLQPGQVLHHTSQKADLLLAAGVVLQGQLLQIVQLIQFATLEVFDFYAIVGQEALFEFGQSLHALDEYDEVGFEVELVEGDQIL